MLLAALAAAAMAAAPPPPVIQGHAVLDCRVNSAGWLRDCKLVSEDPPGRNVGAFALKLAKTFHVGSNDRRIRNGRIRVPLQFKLPPSP